MSQLSSSSCRRCGRPVRVSEAHYETFEQMHYVCFHYEFEHDPHDADESCQAGGCPSAVTALDLPVLAQALNEVLHGPEAIEEWEFQTRMGVTVEQAKALLSRLTNQR